MSIKTRPLTEKERKYIHDRFFDYRVIPKGAFLMIISLIFVTSTKDYLLELLDFQLTKNQMLSLDATILLFFTISIQTWAINARYGEFRKMVKEALRRNQAEVYELDIKRAAKKDLDGEGIGVGFFLETNNNGVLFVSGQNMCMVSGQRPYGENFPSKKIIFTRESVSGVLLDLASDGEKITDILKLSSPSFVEIINGEVIYTRIEPKDGHFYNGALEDVLASFEIKPKS